MIRGKGISEIQLLTVERIDKIIYTLFEKNPAIREVSMPDALPLLRRNGIFIAFHPSDGMALRNLLLKLEKENQLSLFSLISTGRKKKNNRWYFMRQDTDQTKHTL
jgi:hypothetical protein